jgi:hypothetical protein
MAAYCACCGAEITLKAEKCSVCGTPRHGMMPAVKARLVCPPEDEAADFETGEDQSVGKARSRID